MDSFKNGYIIILHELKYLLIKIVSDHCLSLLSRWVLTEVDGELWESFEPLETPCPANGPNLCKQWFI